MDNQNIIIVGANSDLISPFSNQAAEYGFNLLKLTREQWDLRDSAIPEKVLMQIIDFNPNHIIFAAGLNEVLNLRDTSKENILYSINHHLKVNCISLLSLILSLSDNLKYSLTSIHAISSLYGIYGRQTRLPYSLSKHALEGLIKCLALELPETLVLGYRPGFFATKLTDKNLSREAQRKISDRIPMGRFGNSYELSAVILNNIITLPYYSSGSSITMDGGLTAGGIFKN